MSFFYIDFNILHLHFPKCGTIIMLYSVYTYIYSTWNRSQNDCVFSFIFRYIIKCVCVRLSLTCVNDPWLCVCVCVCVVYRCPATWRFIPHTWWSRRTAPVVRKPGLVSNGCDATRRRSFRGRTLRWPAASVRPAAARSTRDPHRPSRTYLRPLRRTTASQPAADAAPAKLAVGPSPGGGGGPRRDLVITSFPGNLVRWGFL